MIEFFVRDGGCARRLRTYSRREHPRARQLQRLEFAFFYPCSYMKLVGQEFAQSTFRAEMEARGWRKGLELEYETT